MSKWSPLTPRERAGRILGRTGLLAVPMILGAVFGFYAADMGLEWLPTFLQILTAATILALAAIIGGKWLEGKAFEGTRLRNRVLALLALALVASGVQLFIFYSQEPAPLTTLDPTQLDRVYQVDTRQYRIVDDELAHLLDRLDGQPMFEESRALSADEEDLLLGAWRAIYDYAAVLEQARIFYEDWYRFDPSRTGRKNHVRTFLLSYAAELTLYEKSRRFAELVLQNDNAEKFLDVAHPDIGLGKNSFSRFRQELHGSRDQARIVAGRKYLDFLESGLQARRDADAWGVEWLWHRIETNLSSMDEAAPIDAATLSVRADAQGLKRGLRRVWYPAQKEVAEWIGDTKVKRPGWYLITREQLETMNAELDPGDILFGRKNWYLSNIGLPGFWPHAILYIGSPDELRAYFDDAAVLDWIEETTGERKSLTELLRDRHPERLQRYLKGDGRDEYRVIEAVSEGVLLNTLEHASGDYLAALRPQLDKVAKAQAILEAFGHLDKPYDFDFDFATDDALVCSEVVWRSYRPAHGKEGLELPLFDVAGRQTLPPNEIIKYWDEHRDDEESPLKFVYFLDADEQAQKAFVADEQALAQSHTRVKIGLN